MGGLVGARYLIKNVTGPAYEEQTKCLLPRLAERVKSGNHQLKTETELKIRLINDEMLRFETYRI